MCKIHNDDFGSVARAEQTIKMRREIFMKYLQKLGKALMLPVACLPICGILMGIGYFLCPETMQGGDITGFLGKLGFFW